jgi:two-component system chemotaxis response regulator CheY
MLRILLCDDDLTTRFLLKRLLNRELSCTVVEADNGVVALKALAQDPFDLLILDLHMPVMDGRETLQVIRDTPALRDLPVVVLTAEKEEQEVRSIIRLGVRAFLLKPLMQERAQARLREALAGIERQPSSDRSTRVRGPVLERGQALVVADGDGDFRQMVASVIGEHFEVHEAANGVEALDLVARGVAPAVLVGRNLPILNADALAAKIRSLPGQRRRLVAVSPKAEVGIAERSGLYDAVVTRTFIPDVFAASMEALLRSDSVPPMERLLGLAPWFRTGVTTAVQHVFGMVLKMDAEPMAAMPASGAAGTIRRTITIGIGEELVVTLTVACQDAGARACAEALGGERSAEDALSEIATAVGGHLEQSLVSRGVAAVQRESAVDGGSDDTPADRASSQWFSVADRGVHICVSTTVAAMDAATVDG